MNLPLAIVTVVGAAGVAVLLMAGARRLARGGPLLREPTRGTPMIMMVSTALAVLLAFVTFAAFQTYNGAKSGARQEAVAVMEMFRTAGLFPAADSDALRADFVCYSRSVVDQEWPAMRRGGSSPLTERWIVAYRARFSTVDLATPRAQLALQELLAEARSRTDARRERLNQATSSVPLPLWLVLILGGFVAVILQASMADRRERLLVQAGLVAGVASIVTAGLLIVAFLDHPYGHAYGVKPTEMRKTLTMMHQQVPALALPCRADGRPL